MWEFGATGKAFRNSGYPGGWAPQPKERKTSVSAPGPSSLLGILLLHQAKQFTFFFSPFVPSRGVPRKTRVPAVTANVHVTGGPPREGQPRDGTAGRLQYKFGQGAALWEMNRPALPCPPARESPLTNHHMTRKVPAFPTISVN